MQKEFIFRGKKYTLEITSALETEGDFQKYPAVFREEGLTRRGFFRLPCTAVEALNRRVTAGEGAFEEMLVAGCAEAASAELYIRSPAEGFNFVVDHRFFEAKR
jgi:hypothetical protein